MAEFGTPETWNMKVGDFIETELPKEKPQALLDLQEQNRKQRLLQSLQKIGSRLEDTSLDFINRNEMAIGGGLIQGTNLGTREGFMNPLIPKALNYLSKLPEGSIIESVEALANKLKMSDAPLRKAMKQLGIKSRYEVDKAEGTIFKIENDPKFKKQFIKDAKTRTPAMIQNDYNISKTSFGRLTRDLKLKAGKDYIEDRGVPTPKLEVTKNANKLLKLLKKDKNIKNFSDVMEKAKFSDVEAMSAIRALNKNLKIPQIEGEIGKPGVIKTRFDIPANLKNKINKIEETADKKFLPFEEELKTKKILSDKDIKNLFSAPSFKLREYLKKGSEFEHALPKSLIPFVAKNKTEADALYITGSRTSPFLNSFKRNFDVTQKSLVQQFLDNKISLNQYNSKINKLRKTIKDATGGYETGYIKFDKNKNPTAVLNATSVKEPLEGFGPRTSQTIKALDNVKFTSNLLKNYKKNKNNPIYGSLKLKDVDLDEVIENYDQIGNEYKKVKPLLSNKEKLKQYAEDNLQSPITKLLFQSPYGKAGTTLSGSALTFSKLAADEGEGGIIPTKDVDGNLVAMELPKTDAETLDEFAEEETSLAGDIGAGAGLTTGAAIGSKATQADPLKGLRRFGKKGAMNLLKILGTPAGVAAYEAGLIPGFDGGAADRLKEGDSAEDVFLRSPTTYAGLPLATLGQEFLKTKPALQRILNLGLSPKLVRMGTPVGIGLMGLTALADSALKFQEEFDALSPEEQKQYLKEQEEFGKDVQGAAEGGRIGFADGPEDPSKRKFMKLMGILSLLPYGLGKLIKPAAKVAPVAAEGVKLGFDKFMMLVNKIKELGIPTKKVTQQEREVGYTYTGKDGSEYELVEDLTTGDLRVTKDKPGFTMSGDEAFDTIEDRSTFVLKKGQADETTKGKTPPDEYDEVKEVASPDGTFDDVDEISDEAIKEVLDEIN